MLCVHDYDDKHFQNSGFVTIVNHGVERAPSESGLTFVHELGHSFNAAHDNNATDNEECVGKGYIMSEVGEIVLYWFERSLIMVSSLIFLEFQAVSTIQ